MRRRRPFYLEQGRVFLQEVDQLLAAIVRPVQRRILLAELLTELP